VIAYVHYPTISSDMLEVVEQGRETFNNQAIYAQSDLYRRIKLFYYEYFASMYGYAGYRADAVMVNSSWTAGHIEQLWDIPDRTFIVYPSCDTATLVQFPLKSRQPIIISVAQFR
jgi:alpha-1,2-mannosyltransferase